MYQGPSLCPITAPVHTQLINLTLASKCCDRAGSWSVFDIKESQGRRQCGCKGRWEGIGTRVRASGSARDPQGRPSWSTPFFHVCCMFERQCDLSVHPERKRETERKRERLYQHACACLFINMTTVTLESDSDLCSAWKILTTVGPDIFRRTEATARPGGDPLFCTQIIRLFITSGLRHLSTEILISLHPLTSLCYTCSHTSPLHSGVFMRHSHASRQTMHGFIKEMFC